MDTKSDGFKVLLGVIGGIVAIVVFGLVLSFAPELARGTQPTPTPGGISVGQYRGVPNVTLIDQDNRPITFDNLRGRAVVLAFGYTHCPDVCPLFMSDMRKIKQALGSESDKVAFMLISVDPKRDTPEALKRYVTAFDPSFIGATADDATLQKTVYAFDGVYEIQKPTGNDPNSYTVAHTAFIYLIGPDGKWKSKFPFGTPVNAVVSGVRDVLRAGGTSNTTMKMSSPLTSPLQSP